MKTLLTLAFTLSLAMPALGADAPAYKAGVATKAITPTEFIWMAGYGSRNKPAEGKVHDLWAKALCLEDSAGKRLVLVTTDLIGIPRTLGDGVASEVEKKHGINRDELILSASHTHCGPVIRENLIDMYPLTKEEAAKVEKYTAKLKDDLVAVIGAAVKDLKPVGLKYGAGKATFAVNRREVTDKGVINGNNPGGPVDHTVPVLVVEDKDGKPLAVVFGYACHNTTMQFYQWSGDYAGFAQVAVEKAIPGVVAMFWTGCGADANPLPRSKIELCEKYGKELADAAVGAIKNAKGITGKFTAKYEKITLKFESVLTKQQLTADTLSKTLAVQKRAERLLKELETNGKIADTYPHYPVQAWGIGDQVLLVSLGGEVVIDYLIRLKKDIATSRTLWVMGYANDVMSYIPSARVLREGGYEADSSQIYYGMPGKWSTTIEDAIITKAKELATVVAPLPKPPGPLTPKEEKESFKLDERFKIDLVASEPDIVDPVAMCFDEKGRMFVCEMRGYPNGGVGTGKETRGKIKMLIDKDGDGVFETVTTFAEGLRFPMGITPYKGGLIVAVAPDVLYLEDTKGTGKADKVTVLYTGFNLANIQQMVNGLQWGLDNWVYGIAGSDGGTITSPQNAQMPAVTLRNRGFRFKPDVPGSLEPISSGGQYGLTADDYQRWFTATNSQHLRQIVLPDHYLKRNPYLAVSAVTLDIPEHGAAAKVFRISPFEPWRVERTMRRAGSPDSKRFPGSELVPGGYFTSCCSPLIYTGNLFSNEFYGNNFVCEPANNLVHRELLKENGAVFKAVRAYEDREFLASTDTWFRPVHLSIGPDGAIYLLDFYREVIETPLSLPDDIKQQLNLDSRGRGRIWRITPKDFRSSKMPDLSAFTAKQLAEELASPNPWHRITAQRLLIQKQDENAAERIRELLSKKTTDKPGRANLLWTLHGLGVLEAADLYDAFADTEPGLREQALRLSEPFLASSIGLRTRASILRNDPSPRVRFQLALSAGALPPEDAYRVIGPILVKDANDPWTVTAALSSATGCSADLLREVARYDSAPNPALTARLAAMVGAKGDVKQISLLLELVAERPLAQGAAGAILDGLGQGMRNSKTPLPTWWEKPPTEAAAAMEKLRKRFANIAEFVRNEKIDAEHRAAAAGLLAYGPFEHAAGLAEVLTPATPLSVQLAAVGVLSAHTDAKVGALLLKNWSSYGPALRREVLEAMLSRVERVQALLDSVEAKKVNTNDLTLAQVQQLHAHPTAAVRTRAATVFKKTIDVDRAKVVKAYLPALDLKGDSMTGKGVFKKSCAACHKLDGVGNDVGANLLAALPNKSGEDLLVAVFDPNREVDPRYLSYQVVTADERVLTGVIVTETPTSVTIRQPDGKEEAILRANVSTLRSTGLSLMPVGLEKELTPQDVADLFAYLKVAGK